jgi:hypothetical protein
MSIWGYLLFIAEPLQHIESCKDGIITGNIACDNPKLADNLTLVVAVNITRESNRA